MIRPEALAWMARWRDAGIGLALVALGVYWAMTALGALLYLAFPVMLFGGLLTWIGVRRARFPRAAGGSGVVDVDERQITYFGPQGGAAVSLDGLARIEVETFGMVQNRVTWVFHADGAPPLRVPGDAENAESLFDALSALPRVNYAAATRAAEATEPGVHTIWQKEARRLH